MKLTSELAMFLLGLIKKIEVDIILTLITLLHPFFIYNLQIPLIE
jgi:hypothetical protein